MRRMDTACTVTIDCTADEAAMLDLMAGEGTTRPNIIRTALWSLADHMGYDPPPGVFDLHLTPPPGRKRGTMRGTHSVPCPRIRQHQKPPKSHIWRRGYKNESTDRM